MDGQANEIWLRSLERIREAVNRHSFDTWFQPTRAVGFSDDTLLIEAPNRFVADWLREHYTALVEESLSQAAERELSVCFSCPSSEGASRDETPREEAPRKEAPAERPSSPALRAPVAAGTDCRPTEQIPGLTARLDPRYTFSNFVVGSGNRFSHAACLAVAEAPAQTYNPLFIYGGVGLGKTHLMQAIGTSVQASGTIQRVCYVSAETFMNEMIYSIQHARTFDFRQKYRSVDILLIDDIQFLAGKESTQEEFFHTFNALYAASKQIVVTSDRAPKEITMLEERLISRFQWGLITDIQPPDLETRVAILSHKAEQDGLALPSEVLLLIAKNARSNIRELEGALVRLVAYSSVTGKQITLPVAEEVLKVFLAPTTRHVTVEDVQKAVSHYYRLPMEAMRARRRTAEIAKPRQVAMYLCRELTSLSLADIGSRFGGRDHTTVLHACDKISQALEKDRELRSVVERISSSLDAIAPRA